MPKHEPEIQTGQKGVVPATGRSPWSLMELHSEVDRLFDDFARGFGWLGRGFSDTRPFSRIESTAPTMLTRVNVTETDDAYQIEADLPGMDEKDIELKVADGVLTISGERKESQEEKKKDYHLMERSYGAFQRSFALPDNVVEDKIDAKFAKGVLTVTLPKSEPGAEKPGEKRIAIKSA